jgi:hypothetical protein
MSSGEKVHPSVKNLPLSDERIGRVKEEMMESFRKNAVGRRLVRTVLLKKDDERREDGFISVGLDHIVDKIWFVDGVFDDTSYSCFGLGRGYGRGLADGETSHVVESILDKCRQNEIHFEGRLQSTHILKALKALRERDIQPMVILANVEDHVQLMRYRNLLPHPWRFGAPKELARYYGDVEVYLFRDLPKGTLLLTDPRRIGELLIKERAEETFSISEIKNHEKEKILKDIPSFKLEMLDEKVEILLYETLKVNITEPNAGLILKRRGAASCEKSEKPKNKSEEEQFP